MESSVSEWALFEHRAIWDLKEDPPAEIISNA